MQVHLRDTVGLGPDHHSEVNVAVNQEKAVAPAPVLWPGKPHGWRSLVGCSPGGLEELDTTERPHCHFSLSCTGEGNGNPLQCSCLENPRDAGAWWAAVYGVAQSRTRLTRLSSSSSSNKSSPRKFLVHVRVMCTPYCSFLSIQ